MWLLLLALSVQEDRSPLASLQTLRETANANPERADLQYQLGLLYTAIGRPREAVEALRAAVELDPENPAYALAYGELLYRGDRAGDALPYLEKASSLPESLLVLASVHEKLGDDEKAMAALERYLESKPEDLDARLILGSKLERSNRLDEALRLYRAGTDAESLRRTAELLSRSASTELEAEQYARRALEVKPDSVPSRVLLARILSRLKREDEALSELERARDQDPGAADVQYQLAQAYQRAGRAEEAKAAAKRFQELTTTEKAAKEREARVAATYKRATELLRSGQMAEADSIFRSVLEIDPENHQTCSMLAKIAFSRNDPLTARRWIEEAIAKDPKVAEYHYLRGLFQARSGELAEAEPSTRRSLELDPNFPEAWSLLGSLLLDSRRADEALQCFLHAAALEPGNPATQLNLASTHAALGNKAEEERAMERYRELSRLH